MYLSRRAALLMLLCLMALCFTPSIQANPTLTPGVWKEITPPGIDIHHGPPPSYGCMDIEIDPVNPSTLYLTIDVLGTWKTTDAGSNWTRLGGLMGADNNSGALIRIDPKNTQHMYWVGSVHGSCLGFWVSTDGGATWAIPQGFKDVANGPIVGSYDVYCIAVDPTDFNHAIITFHSGWASYNGNAGVLETNDGGDTWIIHNPDSRMTGLGYGIAFMYHPASGTGDKNTWLLSCQSSGGFFRTTNAGTTWTKIANSEAMTHGGIQSYYTKDGVYYTGGTPNPMRSTDNGVTWQILSQGLTGQGYYTVCGDGTNLYISVAPYPGWTGTKSPYMTSLESDGLTWTPYNGGTQTFNIGPFTMNYDKVNGILYSSNWDAGVWALKVKTSTGVKNNRAKIPGTAASISHNRALVITGDQVVVPGGLASPGGSIGIYDVKGTLLGRVMIGAGGFAKISKAKTGTQTVITQVR